MKLNINRMWLSMKNQKFAFYTTTLLIVVLVLGGLFKFLYGEKKSNFIVFVGGSETSNFAQTIAKGAKLAAQDVNVNIELIWSNWDFDKMVLQFKQAIDKNPDGIAMMGHPGEDALSDLMDEADRKNILVTSLNVPLPSVEEKYYPNGFGYVGQNVHQAGVDLAKASINRFNIEKGDLILFFGTENIPIRGQRSTGARKIFESNGVEIIYIEKVLFDTRQEASEWQAALLGDLIEEHRDVKLIFDDIGVNSTVKGLREHNIAPDSIPVVGFDLSPKLLQGLKEGYIDLLSDQQAFLQGYFAVQQLTLSHRWKFSGLNINTGSGIVTSNTVGEIEKFVEQGIR